MAIVSAPASSANLGPGFDVLALALDIRCEVEVVAADSWSVTSDGRPVDDVTAEMVRAVAGEGPKAVFVRSAIPSARGLGSSAAVRVATAAAVSALDGEPLDLAGVLRTAAEAEGHPDNAAAAVHGGLVLVDAVGTVHRLSVHPALRVVVAVPAQRLATEEARAVLDDSVGLPVAVRSLARMAALVSGLATADPSVLAAAAGDEVHEAPRASLAPVTIGLVERARRAGALHACWSGAGPAVLAFVTDKTAGTVRSELAAELGGDGEVIEPGIDRIGVRVER